MSAATGEIVVLGGDYEHTLSLSGEAEGLRLSYRPTPAPEIYRIVLGGEIFDVSEFSVSAILMLAERGVSDLVPLPIFPNRAFRHGAILVRRDETRRLPAEFSSARIGVIDFSMTAAVWARALLSEAGLDWRSSPWTVRGQQRFEIPAGLELHTAQADLEDMLADGKIDLLIHPQSRDATLPSALRRTRTLFADPGAMERSFHARTGIFPVNHLVVVHRAAQAKHPRIMQAVIQRYELAKRDALARKLGSTLLPWGRESWHDMVQRFDGDPLPYGLTDANRAALGILSECMVKQGLLDKPADIESIFFEYISNDR